MRLRRTEKRTDWPEMSREAARLIKQLQQKPVKEAYECSPEGILNAYRQGDATFQEAIAALVRWKDGEVQRESHGVIA